MGPLVFRAIQLVVLLMPPAVSAEGVRHFHADLAAEWQTKFTDSAATGRADFHLDLAAMKLSWTIAFKDLTGPPVSLALYGPAQPGANGAKMFELASAGVKSPTSGATTITAAQAQYLLYGWTYVNLTTQPFPSGEVRGQLDVRPPEPAP